MKDFLVAFLTGLLIKIALFEGLSHSGSFAAFLGITYECSSHLNAMCNFPAMAFLSAYFAFFHLLIIVPIISLGIILYFKETFGSLEAITLCLVPILLESILTSLSFFGLWKRTYTYLSQFLIVNLSLTVTMIAGCTLSWILYKAMNR
jgi:hypothetical protein